MPDNPDAPSEPACCWLCQATRFETVFPKASGWYHRCRNCDLYISTLKQEAESAHDQHSRFHAGEHRDLSRNLAKEYAQAEQKQYLREIKSLESFRQTNLILDIGCGTGGFLHAAKSREWEGIGTEIATAAAQAAAAKGLVVYTAPINRIPCEAGSMDVIRMHEVVEHLVDPLAYIGYSHTLLRPGGVLAMTTVNMDSFTLAFQGADWRYVHPRFHTHLFNCRNIRRCLEDNGFTVLRLMTSGARTGGRGPFSIWKDRLLRIPAKVLGKGHRMKILACKK